MSETTGRSERESQALLFDLSHFGLVQLTGPEARTFLHNLCTNDVNGLSLGSGCEAFLTTGQAKTVGHALIDRVVLPNGREALWLTLAPGQAEKIVQHLNRFVISEQVEIADRSKEFVQFHVAGPQAAATVGAVFAEVPDLKNLHHVRLGEAVYVRRHDPLGLPGFDVICPVTTTEAIRKELSEAGARPSTSETYQVLRIEAGTPEYGQDIDDTNLPQEIGRDEQALSFTKGCYIGQETIARLRTYGHVNRSLVGLRLATKEPPPRGSKLSKDGKEVGQITSSVFSPTLGTAIALGIVRRGNQQPGTVLDLDTASGRVSAEVVTLPFRNREEA